MHKLVLIVPSLMLAGCFYSADCVYRCTFDDETAIRKVPSNAKVMSGAGLSFVDGVKGMALQVSPGMVPVKVDFEKGLPVEKGCISYWVKLLEPSPMYTGETYFLSFNGWYMMHRISVNTGAGTSGWQASIGGFHLYGTKGCGARPYSTLFSADADSKAWHHYEFVWNTNGIRNAESKVVQYRIDGKEVLSASKSDFDAARFVSHMNTCRKMVIGGADKAITERPFLIDELEIRATDECCSETASE